MWTSVEGWFAFLKFVVTLSRHFKNLIMEERSMEQSTYASEDVLKYTYPFFRDMADNNVIFCFKGQINADIITYILDLVEDALEEDIQNRKLAKKLSNVMIECLTDIYDEGEDEVRKRYDFDPDTILVVRKLYTDTFIISTGQFIPHSKVKSLKEVLTRVNAMSFEEVKEAYKRLLLAEDMSEDTLNTLRILDLAKKSREDLNYSFKYLNPAYAFFVLEAKISRESL